MNKEEIKQAIVNHLDEHRGQVTFAELVNVIPVKGDLSIFHPKGENIVIWCEVTEAYAEALDELMRSKTIRLDPCTVFSYYADGKLLGFPLAKKSFKYKKPHWLPMFINKGENWTLVK